MSSRWWFPFDGMEEMSFKRVPEGWLYRAPNPWLFGSGRYYLLDEEQKSELAVQHRRMWRFLFPAILVLVVVGVPLISSRLDEHPFAVLAAAILVGLVVGFVCNAYLFRKIRPIIAGLQPTTQRITQGDVLKIQTVVFSRGYLIFFGVLSLALFALAASRALLTSAGWDFVSLCGAVLFGAGTIYWFALYIAKRKRSAV